MAFNFNRGRYKPRYYRFEYRNAFNNLPNNRLKMTAHLLRTLSARSLA